MKTTLKPRVTAVVETLEGQRVRIVSMCPISQKVKVKSLTTGLPFFTTAEKLQLPQ